MHRQERDARRTGGGGLGGGPKSASEGIADTERPRRLPSERPIHEAEYPTHGALTEAPCLMPYGCNIFCSSASDLRGATVGRIASSAKCSRGLVGFCSSLP